MLEKLIQLKDSLSPTGAGNTDPVMFDYKFWSDLESLAKKKRAPAKEKMLALATRSSGIILKSTLFRCRLEESKPVQTFDLEKMIDILVRKYPKDRVFIREAALKAKIDGETRKTYIVERRDEDE